MLPLGSLLHGRYHIIQELGSGGFATVYLAQDTRINGRYVAIKAFDANRLALADRAWARKSFLNEAQVLARLNHAAIADVSDSFSAGGLDFLVMDYVPGETLTQAWLRLGKRIQLNQVLIWAQELCRVLDYLHQQNPPIIFRDLKPDNIMVQPNGRLKIIDFGIVRHFKQGKTQDTRVFGTPGYAAPEQYGQQQTDARADIYSLAAVLYQLLTGYDPTSTPMHFPPILSLNPQLPPHVAAAIQRALDNNRDRRFSQAGEFAVALGTPIAPSAVPPSPPAKPTTIPWLWAVVGIVGVLIVLALALGLWLPRQIAGIGGQTAVNNTPAVMVMVTQVDATPLPETVLPATAVTGDVVENTAEPTDPPTAQPSTVAPPTVTPEPVLSPASTLPDNSRAIVFDSTRNEPQAEIYIMNSDGSNQRRLTANTIQDDDADLSPDAQWIAFDRGTNRTESIWLMRTDGSDAKSLVNGRAPDWSPDGRYLAYETIGDSPHIHILELSSGISWALTRGSRAYRAPDWSPDMSQIVAMAHFGSDWQIVILDVDTGSEQRITSGSGDKRFPAWSPDGSLIAYNTLDSRGWPDDIWLIEPTGLGARPITNSGNNGRPTWSPDGRYLVFNSYLNNDWVLYQMDADGRQGTPLTIGVDDQRASWSN